MYLRLFIALTLFLTLKANAQVLQWEKAYQRGYQHELRQVFTTRDGEVLLLSKVQRSQSKIYEFEVLHVGWDGTLEWNETGLAERVFPLNPPQPGKVMGMGVAPMNCSMCAVGFSPSWSLQTLDLQDIQGNFFGASVYMMDIDIPWSFEPQLPRGYFYASNADYLAFGSSIFYRNAWDENMNSYTLVRADSLSETVLYVGASNQADWGFAVSPTQAGFIDTAGVFSAQLDFGFTVDSVGALDSDTAMLLYSASKVYVLSSAFTWVDSLDWQSHLDACRSISYRAGTFHALGEQNGQVWVKSFSNNTLVGSFAPDTQKVDFRYVTVASQGDRWMLIGTETSVPNKHVVIQVYGAENVGYLQSNLNLAVVEVVEKPVEVISCLPNAPNPEYYEYHQYAAMVKVQNMGSDSVFSFYLNGTWTEVTYYPTFVCNLMNCRDSVFAVEFVDTPIAPGDFVWVEVTFREGIQPIAVQPVCVWVSTPNGQPDRVPEDDQLCKDIVLSVPEAKRSHAGFTLQPNPSVGAVQVRHSCNSKSCLVALYDLQGRCLLRQPITGADAWISLPERLTAGLYMVQLFSNETLIDTQPMMLQR